MSDTEPAVVVRELSTLDECRSVDPFLASVWGPETPRLGVELLRALTHAGGYAAGAYLGGDLVGVSVGFLAYDEGMSLHSHVTGVSARTRDRGVGMALKSHQRSWALNRGIRTITWTFDPLVRRNAWFNVERLGARPVEYLVDFYGPMSDSINAGSPSDRLLVRWDVSAPPPDVIVETLGTVIAVPHDIERLRSTDPTAAHRWRLRLREQLQGPVAAGQVVGFRRSQGYVLGP
jgi:predicted GNAT superfamily acetyltransferase